MVHFTDGLAPLSARTEWSDRWVRFCGYPICKPYIQSDVTKYPNEVDCPRCDQILIKRALDRVMKEVQEETANA